ncbi:MAG TPA: M20/M25/M40 family metallo-hydrolase [Blastocatellia bacterium]|nr:M20/M25/M40 family metallo-hydrolase [Blastocatellia bacterium]
MLKRHISVLSLVILLIGAVAPAVAQNTHDKPDADIVAKIKEEGLKHSQVMEVLSYITDVYGPRLTCSPNIKAAQEWTKQKLTSWGLQNAHLEAWGPFGRGWSLDGFSANVTSPQFIPLIAYPKAWSPSTNGEISGQPVYLDAKTPADLDKYQGKLKGAIVLIEGAREVKAHFDSQGRRLNEERLLELANAEPSTGGGQFGRPELTAEQKAAQELALKKWQMCYSEGAAVVLEPGRGDGGTMFVQSVNIPAPVDTPFDQRPRPWAKEAPAVVPQVVVAVEHYNRIIRMIDKGTPVKLGVNISTRFYDQDPMSYNVVAEIPGTDLKDEVVMLGGHFDSWHSGTGATDNGAGSAVALEAVRIIQSLRLKPRRTIRIALWSGEEEGLLGSRAYVTEHFGKRTDPPRGRGAAEERPQAEPTFELKPDQAKVAGYFNLDNGTGKVRGVYLQGNEAVRSIFRAWLAPFKDMGASTLSISNTGGTDHLSFDAVGIPGFQFIQDPIEYDTRTHHSNQDVYDRIQEDDMKQAAIIMASFVYNTAMRDEKLPRKPLPGADRARAAR